MKLESIDVFALMVLQETTVQVKTVFYKNPNMAKHTLKVSWCSHRKVFKIFLAIFQHYVEIVY